MLATKHGKLLCIAPALEQAGLGVDTVAVDTDLLGTFTGDVPRTAPPLETAVAKARLGMSATGNPIGLASEGSIGAHPAAPWMTVDREIVVLVDDERGITVAGFAASWELRAVARTVHPGDDLSRLLADADIPAHALIVAPNAGSPEPVRKGLRRPSEIATAVKLCSASSPDGAAQVQTDLRAHVCPSRQRVIRAAAEDLAARLRTRCPVCGSPGWGRTDVVRGVPCRWCATQIDLVRAEIDSCPACEHREERPIVPHTTTGDPGQCARCNP
ncbi:MAG: hypothetical protein KG028_07625 [Actinobacteria bacterium]|nr:hypothetical protein [Actinomycetota bacterium]